MTEQTKAQRLADRLEDESGGVLLGFIPGQPVQEKELDCNFEAAAELRRLDALVGELVEVLLDVTASLVAAHSLLQNGGKKAAASDKMFSLMLNDYEKSFELGRAVLAKAKEQT